MILNMNKSLNIVIIYSFHLSFYQSYIQLTKKNNPKVLLIKVNRKKMIKKLLSMPFFYAFNWKNELRQLCIKTSWSTLIQNLFLRGPAFVISWTPWFWSNPSDCTDVYFVIRMFKRNQDQHLRLPLISFNFNFCFQFCFYLF